MIDGRRVVVWTPYGRERTVSVLARYLERDHYRGIVDEWWLCLNTEPEQVSDLRYAIGTDGLIRRYPTWVRAMNRPAGLPRLTPKQRNTGYFYRYMTDPDTVYVRFDDDIVYVHPDAIERIVRHVIATEGSGLCSMALTWNNAIVSWFEQRAGVIPVEFGRVDQRYCMDPVAWADGAFAVKIHHLLLGLIEDDNPTAVERVYLHQDMPLAPGEQFSVSCFGSSGKIYASLDPPGVLVPDEEESWHTIHYQKRSGLANMIVGNALVSHFTFAYQQREVLASDVLARYRALAERLSV